MTKIIEMSMRYKGHVRPFEGVTQRGLWNLRTFDLGKVHTWTKHIARYGNIYTTLRDITEIHDEGETKQVYRPAWTEYIKEETDLLIYNTEEKRRDRNGKLEVKFKASVATSKAPKLLKTGEEFDLTNITISKYLQRTGRLKFFDRFPKLQIKKKIKNILDD